MFFQRKLQQFNSFLGILNLNIYIYIYIYFDILKVIFLGVYIYIYIYISEGFSSGLRRPAEPPFPTAELEAPRVAEAHPRADAALGVSAATDGRGGGTWRGRVGPMEGVKHHGGWVGMGGASPCFAHFFPKLVIGHDLSNHF